MRTSADGVLEGGKIYESFCIVAGMIDRPGQAMKAATEKPRSWLIPAILIVLSTVVLLYVSQPTP
jgi:hypothetical protein